MAITTHKGFIKDYSGNRLLPITRGELVLDLDGKIALKSHYFAAGQMGPDGTINDYGLISSADLAKITGSENGGLGLGDIYAKLANINSAIIVDNKTITFYDENGKTDIKIVGTDNNITVAAYENTISINLAEINTEALSGENFIKSMTVDKYGRVTALNSGTILNSEIPPTLTDKILENAKLHSTNIDPKNNNDIASKKYVDDQFNSISTQAVGALQFGGSIGTTQGAEDKLKSGYKNYYYVITDVFDLDSDYVENSKVTDGPVRIKTGDTLIVKESTNSYKFVHVPSGDDITAISIKGVTSDSDTTFEDKGPLTMVGPVTFQFNAPFVVTNSSAQIVGVSMRPVSDTSDGYLSHEDYVTFKNYSSDLSITYTSAISETDPGAYKIGDIKVGDKDPNNIYGVNYTYSLQADAPTTGEVKTPYLSFKENNTESNKIYITGGGGILTNLSDDKKSIEIHANNTVNEDYTDYLSISNGSIFSAIIGSGLYDTEDFKEGLTKYSDFAQFQAVVASHITHCLKYEILTGSLRSESGATGDIENGSQKTYKYGSDTLKLAIKFE